jgi:hypothetical protein
MYSLFSMQRLPPSQKQQQSATSATLVLRLLVKKRKMGKEMQGHDFDWCRKRANNLKICLQRY